MPGSEISPAAEDTMQIRPPAGLKEVGYSPHPITVIRILVKGLIQ